MTIAPISMFASTFIEMEEREAKRAQEKAVREERRRKLEAEKQVRVILQKK